MRLVVLFVFAFQMGVAQQRQTENLIIVTLDGFRWQELFRGADSTLINNKNYTNDNRVRKQFFHSTAAKRREALLPFMWGTIASQGQLYGNRDHNNTVNCTNLKWFSYPGYSELLVGFVDSEVKSNEKIENPNATVLEFIEQQPGYENEVAVFATWETIPFITREATSAIPANAGNEPAEGTLSPREELLNELQELIKNPYGARYDAFTFYYAFEYLKRTRPKVLFISLDETDEHAHGGRYDQYLLSAHRTDAMLHKLWAWLQSDEQYCNKTTLLITTDHGRGNGVRSQWRDHGLLQLGSGQIWMAVLGPDSPATGEVKQRMHLQQKQFAKTAAAFLGLNYTNKTPVGEVIDTMFATPTQPVHFSTRTVKRN